MQPSGIQGKGFAFQNHRFLKEDTFEAAELNGSSKICCAHSMLFLKCTDDHDFKERLLCCNLPIQERIRLQEIELKATLEQISSQEADFI